MLVPDSDSDEEVKKNLEMALEEQKIQEKEDKIDQLQQTLNETQKEVVKSEELTEMTSLSVLLSSGLNTEMVYTILYGICKFSLLNNMKNALSEEQLKEFRDMEYQVDQNKDTTITLRQVQIKDSKQWENK